MPDKNTLVLVTGTTGVIGPRVVNALYHAGYLIRTFSIDTPASEMFPQNVVVFIGDVTDQAAVQSVMQGVDAVVHLAALLHIADPPSEMREKYERVNVGGTSTIVEAAINEGVKRVVLFSTIAVYGQAVGHVFNEQSLTHPETYYAQTKLAAEKIVLNAKRKDGQPLGVVLRLGAVYGSRVKGNYERLTRALARNRFIPVGNGLNRRTLVFDKDVGRAVVLAISHPDAAGRVFNVTDGEFRTLNEIIESICAALGRRPPRFSIPIDSARLMAGILEDGMRLVGCCSPVTRKTVDKYTEDIAVSSKRIREELGFIPQYDLKTGWRETIQEMRDSGVL